MSKQARSLHDAQYRRHAYCWIDPSIRDRLIGFRVKVFIAELQSFCPVYMSVAEALLFAFNSCSRDVEAMWLSDDGEIIESFATFRWNRANNAVGICMGTYNTTPCVRMLGYRDRGRSLEEIDAVNVDNWFHCIGETAYAIGADLKHDSRKPSVGHFEGRKNQLLNRAGLDVQHS